MLGNDGFTFRRYGSYFQQSFGSRKPLLREGGTRDL